MGNVKKFFFVFYFAAFVLAASSGSALAYIGPGAGFAFLTSFLVFFIAFFLAIFYLLFWPLRFAYKAIFRKVGSRIKTNVRRVIVIGLDGMDPELAGRYMNEGLLPNFERLHDEGTFSPLATSYPSISPVAWSSFMTGVDPSYHNIYDFLTRDPCTYLPMLSSAEIGKASRVLPLGKYMIPLGKPKMKLLRKSQPFWKVLGESGVFSSIIRVPITFPPEEFNGVLLSGMCAPDLKGSQGTFSFYTTKKSDAEVDSRVEIGGAGYHVEPENGTIRTHLYGPENTLVKDGGELKLPLTVKLDEAGGKAEIEVSGERFELEPGNYSPWKRVVFRPGLGTKVYGICRFYINRITPEFEMYVTPINIDPENPALPISHPFIYSAYMAKMIGPYGTLGLAEDTWALNEGAIDEEAFLKQAYYLFDEREKMFFQALSRTPEGLCACVFDTTDRVQHMFFRCLDDSHPANRGKEVEKYRNVIRDLYIRMDELLGKVLEEIDEKTALFIISDHGFTQFKRGVNLNTWLLQNGYLHLKDGNNTSGEWFEDVDWERTRAFSLGLTGLFINRNGREERGVVEEGEELRALKRELIQKLTGLVDEETGEKAILTVVDTESNYSGPYTYDAPDLLIGYNAGYRHSWSCAVGRVTETVFEDNTKHWSGDHCVDPEIVPGILFSNLEINSKSPDIKDLAPTVLSLFGVDIPAYMTGSCLVKNGVQSRNTQPERERKQKVGVG